MSLPVRTLFIDRDGILNRMRPDYVKSWEELELLPGAIEAVVSASRRGFDVIVLTNQSAIGRGLVSRQTVDDVHRRLAALVRQAGGSIHGFLVCPHRPDEGCTCRKPAPGLFLRAADELGVDLATAVMVGDQPSDIEAARRAGCAAVLVGEAEPGTGVPVVDSLAAAVDLVAGLPSINEAIVLCGGLGTRLRGLLGGAPKSLAQIHGRPFIEWLLIGLAARGVRRAVLAAGFGADRLREHFETGSDFGLDVSVSAEPEALGTGGAARLAAAQTSSSPLVVLNGDSYCRYNLIQLALMHRAARGAVTLWLQHAERADRFGSVAVAPSGSVTSFDEKVGGSGFISAGVYLADRNILEDIPSGGMVSLERDFFPRLVGHGLCAVIGSGPFADIGTPEAMADAERLLGGELDLLEKKGAWTSA